MEERFGSQDGGAAGGGEGRAPGERAPRRSGWSPLNLRRATLALAVGFSLYVLPTTVLGQGWYDGNWGYRKKITIDNTMVAGDLANFPVLLDFTDTDLRDKARSDGWDILFTADDGTTKLDHDFEDYDGASGAIVVWVEVTNLSGSVDTDIYMYYGYATVPSNQENETGTWSNGYEAVYHLHNNSFADATGNHDATNSGSASTTGIAGDGRNFVRSEDDYIDTGWNPSLTGDFTFEGWFRALGQTSSGDVWGVEDRGGGDNSEIRLAVRDTDSNNSADGYNLEIKADAPGDISDEGALPGDPDDGNWHHIALVREGATGRLYYDGSYITLNDSLTTSGTAGFPVSLLMGAQWDTDGGGPPAVRNRLNGDLDETRVSTVLRTEDYFATQVANVNNSAPGGFYDFLSGEESAGLIGHWNFNEGSGQVAADASPSNNDGTLGPTAAVESGDPTWACSGTALEFDGSDDEVKLSSVAIGDRAAWSISAWIKIGPDAADKRTIYGEGDTTQREYLFLDVAQADSVVTFYSEDYPGSVYTQLDGTSNVQDDQWHLVTVVQRSKTDRVLYVDASPEDSSTQDAGTLSFNTASIGYLRSEGWVADPFLGIIDDVRIYDYALNTAEIATLYANPPGPCGAASGGVVMMLVADAVSRDPVDDSLAAYLEAQGLTVVFADDNLTGAQIEDSISAYNVDVLYVSQTCGSSTVDDTYLTNLTIGIVMPNVGNWDGFELANHDGESTGPTVGYVADNSHYITQPFSTGNLTLYSSATPLGYGDMGFGSGADVLMHVPGDPTTGLIVAYEAGATLETGNPADGRRVGLFTEGEDWGYFTADTKTLIYRSILWGGGLAGGAGTGDAVTSATAEISPNDVTTNDTGVEFIYAILATIGGTDTGVDRVEITVPNSFGLPSVDSVRVGGSVVGYTDNTASRLISIDLDTKLTSTDSIQVYFTADAPTAPDALGQDFTSTVDDSGTGAAAQSTTEGNADGDAGDANSWTVTTTDSGGGGPTPPGGICPAANTVSTGSTITNQMKIQHTTPAGPDRLMLVGVSINNDDSADTVISITYNGVGLSRIGTIQNADDARVEIWQLVNPPAVNDTVTITFGKDLLRSAVAGVITFTGADQTPIADFYGNFADGTNSSVTVTSAAGEMVFALMSGETTGVPTLQNSPPAIERWNLVETAAPPDEYGAAATDSGAAPNVTLSWTHGNDHWAAGGVSMVPAAACLNAAPSISSAANQTFQVGDPTTAASTITIAEDASYQTITDTDDLRVRIPSGLDMIWDTLQATIVVGGNASTKVSTTVSYEDAGKTAVIDVTTSFAATDTITVDSLKFMDFGSVSAADSLELEVKNDGLVSAVDDKTKEITAAAGATLLGRYWFNEAPSGQAPDTVYDDQASPVNLEVTYDTGVEWVVTDGHRGLYGPNGTHTGVAQADATGTKYQTTLDGASQASFVVVTEWTNSGAAQAIAGFYTSGGSRVVHFGTLTNGALDIWIRTETQSDLRVRWGGTSFADGTRRVFHVVYDSDDPTPENRVRLYVDGVDQGVGTLGSGSWPAAGEALDLSGSISIAALNEAGAVADPTQGTVFYYAVYDGELTASEISTDATALLADDDNISPAVAVTPDGLGAPILRQAGTDYSYEFVVENTSSILDDYDLLTSTDPASSFVSVDSITFNGLSFTAPPDSARLIGLAAGVSDTITVWYTVASDTDGNIDTLYLAGRSVTETAATDSGYIEIEYDVSVASTPLVQYWIDEAPSGQGVTNLVDAASNPLNMPLNYPGTSPYWAGDSGGNRHLRFSGTSGTDTGGGVVNTDGTKLDAVHGATQVTIEVKYMMDGGGTCSNEGERIFGLSDGDVSTSGWLAVRERAGRDVLQVQWQGQTVGVYALETGCPISSASVVHWVVDTTEPVAADRIRAYIDGVQATVTAVESTSLPSQDETIDLGSGTRRMFVGRNHGSGGFRTFNGRVWYAALYLGEMTDGDIASSAAALLAMDDNNTYDVTVTPDGASVVRLVGTDYSYDFTLNNGSSVLEDFDLLASTDPASSFITIDSITGGGISDSGVADSTRIYGVDASADSTVTVWYTIAADTDGNIDTLYLRGRSISDTAQSDLGWIEIEYETMAFTVTPDGADTLQLMPTGTATSSSYKFTITNSSTLSETFDLLAFDGAVLTVDSITGPNVSGGSPGDSARTGAIAASAEDSAFVWFTVSVGTAGALDSLYLMGRSVGDPSATDSGWVFVELLQPDLLTSKVANPNGTQPPGTDLTYTLTITNNGTADGVNVVTVDSLAAEVYFQVGSVVTTLPTGMSDSIEYYDGCGSDGWSYTPVSGGGGAPAGYDACAVRIRWTLLNDFSYVAPDNTADLEFVARIK